MWKKIFSIATALAVVFCACGRQGAVKFGIIADIQYHQGKPQGERYYSASIGKLDQAIAQLNREKVQFAVNLGDSIDRDIQSFDAVMPAFTALKSPVYHVIGNHDFEVQAGDEDRVLAALGLKQTYYAFDRAGWRFIFLDGVELRYPFPADEILKKEAEALYLRLRTQGRENVQDGYGGLGLKQISWLDEQLQETDKSGKSTLVLCHSPVLPEAACNLWNDREVVSVLEKHPSVKAYFSGHNHAGGYAFRNGIHYLTFRGMVETPDQNAFAVVTLKKGAIQIKGFGREPSRTLELSNPPR
jgi:manganese-dependent ADP-ribose/CDP-alcohol diphosphatase